MALPLSVASISAVLPESSDLALMFAPFYFILFCSYGTLRVAVNENNNENNNSGNKNIYEYLVTKINKKLIPYSYIHKYIHIRHYTLYNTNTNTHLYKSTIYVHRSMPS